MVQVEHQPVVPEVGVFGADLFEVAHGHDPLSVLAKQRYPFVPGLLQHYVLDDVFKLLPMVPALVTAFKFGVFQQVGPAGALAEPFPGLIPPGGDGHLLVILGPPDAVGWRGVEWVDPVSALGEIKWFPM